MLLLLRALILSDNAEILLSSLPNYVYLKECLTNACLIAIDYTTILSLGNTSYYVPLKIVNERKKANKPRKKSSV